MCRLMMGWYFFFFSSRRRHTSWPRDWSSDVCSSDLGLGTYGMTAGGIWTYTLDNSNSTVESLNNGQSTTDTFTVTTVDGTAKIGRATSSGSKDAAVIAGTATGSAVEAGGGGQGTPGTAAGSGKLSGSHC